VVRYGSFYLVVNVVRIQLQLLEMVSLAGVKPFPSKYGLVTGHKTCEQVEACVPVQYLPSDFRYHNGVRAVKFNKHLISGSLVAK